ncbi:anaerobic C4-dicarboxylate transporter [Shewanella sp. SR43-4]|jgi:anaerobic C4-dicarboxylate transporter DcuB|uniref:anaerobic C4-dicarboxylate transporter n=2 Tax=Shewanellaceae TaxID=267890 RepID=UPI000C5A14E0|nr:MULTISPECIES: anaerobic C4-dicarboxylate transporter [Shewanella]NCQ46880.1 anaerobic C4-dicarboxylate transporter [Shewanella frigidimarina]MBB1319596.1 anaerobic C4-dicarboxylate transporter [Shewanella sp. SR43-4]NCP36234.1 anaerobic C4-dicarboxylate transporter [Shewanella vesiculosa]NCP69555.1 anaerobic C4-dicarboxylate transporter [Shewanella vesiculosa]NCP73898.1 anaerobic C4-dicarboxylate transporter [Shewanella vesiculosa]
MFYVHMLLLLAVIFVGIRHGGIAFGLLGGLGVSVLAFVFGIAPGSPPVSVMLIILAVVAASATLEATGGLKLLVKFAEKLLRKHPEHIVFLGPLCTYSLTVLVGTGHSVYPLLPVIYDVSYKKGIRPERPLAMATVASQMGITASPIAAAAAVVLATAVDNNLDINLLDVLMVTIPATLTGLLVACTWSLKRGKDLDKDEEFQARLTDDEFRESLTDPKADEVQTPQAESTAKKGLTVFLLGIFAVIMVAMFSKQILPAGVKMSVAIQFMMLSVGGIILLATNISPKKIVTSNVFTAGMTAVIIIFGIAWMSDTIIEHHKTYLVSAVSDIVSVYPWTFAIAMFVSSIFLKSQAAVLTIMLPLGFSLGIPAPVLIGVLPACYAYFFFPFYPSDLAAISFDRTGTTHIGKYVLNHSFIIPGFIGVVTATFVGYFISMAIN